MRGRRYRKLAWIGAAISVILVFIVGASCAVNPPLDDPEALNDPAPYRTSRRNFAIVSVCLAIFLVSLVVWIIELLRRHQESPLHQPSNQERLARVMGVATSLLYLSFPIILVSGGAGTFDPGGVFSADGTLIPLAEGTPFFSRLSPALAVGVMGVITTLGAVAATYLAWRRRYWTLWGRIHYTLFTLAALVFALWLRSWHWLAWRV